MAQQCPLTAPLTLKDTQNGFAGQTGTVWTIMPDCSFTVARQYGPRIAEPHRSGRLPAEQLARLGDLLGRVEQAAPPARAAPPQVNARSLTLDYRGKVSVVSLAPGVGGLGEAHSAAGATAAPMLDLAHAVREMTGG